MRKADVLKYFDGNQSAVARALGITRSSVNSWGELVPPLSAARLAKISKGKLKFDPDVYDNWNTRRTG